MGSNTSKPFRVGVSACLLGENVRYNGGHQHSRWITDVLGQFVEFVPVCPEVGCGMGIPREAVRLVGDPGHPRLVGTRSGEDWTERMHDWGENKLQQLEKEDLSGFIFKSRSPSSGMQGVKVYNPETGQPASYKGTGYFAKMIMDRFPLLPFEDDGRLNDAGLRENFIERLFTHYRLHRDFAEADTLPPNKSRGRLVAFHTKQKLMLMAHSPAHYKELGKLVSGAKERPFDELFADYKAKLFEGLKLKATRPKNKNVLHHVLGYFKKSLTAEDKKEALELIDRYSSGDLPLIVPVTLLNHYVRKFENDYLAEQYYMHPHPLELRLRNHA